MQPLEHQTHHLTTSPPHHLGLALSGGGARGIAHLGVLAALDELALPIAQLAGVSSGGIAATFYAAGFKPREILQLLLSTNVAKLTRPAFSRYGLLYMDAVQQLLARHLGASTTFADLKVPLTLVATDLIAGESVYFNEGPLLLPLLATSAVPIIYRAVEYQGRQLVDGGLLNNLPVEPLLGQPGLRVVGVHCNPINPEARIPSFRRLIERTLHLAINANTVARKGQCHLLLEPPELRHYQPLGYRLGAELFEIGYRYTLSKADELRAL
jgi:NTE family protein